MCVCVGGGGRLEDVFVPGIFFTGGAILSFNLYIIQYVQHNLSYPRQP